MPTAPELNPQEAFMPGIEHFAWAGQLYINEFASLDAFFDYGPQAIRAVRIQEIAAMALRTIQRPFAPESTAMLPAYRYGSMLGWRNEIISTRSRWAEYHNQIEDARPLDFLRKLKADDRSWPEWLTTPPNLGGPTREDLMFLADWNLQVMCRETKHSRKQLNDFIDAYLEDTEQVVQASRLSPDFLQKARSTIPYIRQFISGPLQPINFHGIAFPKYNVTVLHPTATDRTIDHEYNHLVGGVTDKLWNEVIADLLTDERHPDDPEEALSVYKPAKMAIKELIDGHISAYELSEIFVKGDRRQNTQALKQLVTQRLGRGVFDLLRKSFSQNMRYYRRRRCGGGEAYFAGLDLLRLIDPNLSYEDAIRKTSPQYPDEYIAKTAARLETFRNCPYQHFLLSEYEIILAGAKNQRDQLRLLAEKQRMELAIE
jgi:hypothetical protein